MAEFWIDDYWQTADGDDYTSAVSRILATVTSAREVCVIKVQPKTYYFTQTVTIDKLNVVFKGPQGQVRNWNNSASATTHNVAMFVWTANVTGIQMTTSAGNSLVIENVILKGNGGTTNPSCHGIDSRYTVFLRNGGCVNWGGRGLSLIATAGSSDSGVVGNANYSSIEDWTFEDNGTCGSTIVGADTNVLLFKNCYWQGNGAAAYAQRSIATTAVYVKATSRSIVSSSISSGVLTCEMGVSQSTHGYVVGDLMSTTGLSANVTRATVTGVSGTTITCAISSADNATNGAGTITPAGSSVKIATALFSSPSYAFQRFDNIISEGHTTNSGDNGAVVQWASSTLIAYELDSASEGLMADGVGTISGLSLECYDSTFLTSTYLNRSVGSITVDTYRKAFKFDDANNKMLDLNPYTEGSVASDIYGGVGNIVIGGNANPTTGSSGSYVTASSAGLGIRKAAIVANAYVDDSTTNYVRINHVSNTAAFLSAYTGSTSSVGLHLMNDVTSLGTVMGGMWEWLSGSESAAANVALQIGEDGNTRGMEGQLRIPSTIHLSKNAANSSWAAVRTEVIGSNNVILWGCDGTYNISGCANDGGGEVRITASSHTFQNGERVVVQGVSGATGANGTWIVKDRAASTIDLTSSTFGGSYTASTGLVFRAVAIGFGTTAPASGTWGVGDRIYNTSKSASNPIDCWVCIATGAPGTWQAIGIPPAQLSSNHGNTETLYFSVTSGGSSGTADDFTIYNAAAPFKFRIIDAAFICSTAVGASTVDVRSASGGGGSSLTSTISSGSTGVNRMTGLTATATVSAGGSLYLRRSDRSVVGELLLTIIKEA